MVRYSAGALTNLTLSQDASTQLSVHASQAVAQREVVAVLEAFAQRRARRAIGRGVGRMSASRRLTRLLNVRPLLRLILFSPLLLSTS